MTSAIRRVAKLDRLRNSRNGNPRYRVTFEDGSCARTKSDAEISYGITNPELRGAVRVSFTPSGDIWDMKPVG